ncbi:molybdenum cofactor guanylyltransferase [Ruminobacter amylophilus]|uniref:molybdenum cofactor guanylyltransferase n=1 Tax=Ruminobacter amylophilus TaxID=867 RepID=UPI0038648230
MQSLRIGVAVMAGGKSSRMGCDKAELMHDSGDCFLTALCKRLDFFAYRYVSVNGGRGYLVDGFEPVMDTVADAGPAGGILSVLSLTEADAVLVLACDMPDFTADEAIRLVSLYDGEDVLVPVIRETWQPLAAIYSKNTLQVFRDSLDSGNFRLRDIIRRTRFRTVQVPRESEFNYVNINTQDEYRLYECNHSILF